MPHPDILRENELSTGPAAGPSAFWMCAGFLLAGMGTVLLGPILPALSASWHMRDADAGLLLATKFTGAFLGGATVPRRLDRGILFGMIASFAGFGAFALSPGPRFAAGALFVGGIGLGQIIASTNILAGQRFRRHTGSALAAINFFWSLGAVVTGLIVASVVPHTGLRAFVLSFAAMFAVVGAGGVAGRLRRGGSSRETSESPEASEATVSIASPDAQAMAWNDPVLLSFALMLFLYGGLETSLTQWITTFSVRYQAGPVQSAIVLVWSALTVGRIATSAVLRRVREERLRRWAMAASVALLGALAFASRGWQVVAAALLLGLSLAPFFPATFALLMERRPSARAAGLVLAVSGLGAAALSWAVGAVSTRSGSLRVGMLVPMAAAAALLGLSLRSPAGLGPSAGRSAKSPQ